MALEFRPIPYVDPRESGREDSDRISQSIRNLGESLRYSRMRKKQDEAAALDQAIKQAQLQSQFGSIGARKILKPATPIPGAYGPNVSPSDFNYNDPAQASQAQGFFGESGVKPILEATKRSYDQREQEARIRKMEAESGNLSARSRALGQNDGKPPAGYRWTPEGSLEAIPGGPAYTKAGEKSGDMDAAFNLYSEARRGLLEGLRGTNTGPIAGRIPAFTSGQQVAQGGVAAMAPVLKQLFRVAGEGVFTDRDQQLLLDMIPTRTTNPDAITTQMENIDNIVRAKLRMPRQGGGAGGDEPMTRTIRNKRTGETKTQTSMDGGQTWN